MGRIERGAETTALPSESAGPFSFKGRLRTRNNPTKQRSQGKLPLNFRFFNGRRGVRRSSCMILPRPVASLLDVPALLSMRATTS